MLLSDRDRLVSVSPYQFKDDPHSSHGAILSMLGRGEGRRALDAGAADGFLAERLTGLGWTVTAVELDPVQAERARGKCHEVIVGDLAEVAAKLSGPFDAIVYGDVIEHLSDPLPVLMSVDQHLGPDGRVVVSVPNVAHLWVRLGLLMGRFDYEDRGILDRTHLRCFTRKTFLALLAAAGLTVEELRVTPVPLPLAVPRRYHGRWLEAAHSLSAWCTRRWHSGLAYQFVAACRPFLSRRGDGRAHRGPEMP